MKKLLSALILGIICISCNSERSFNDYLEDEYPDEIIRERGFRKAITYSKYRDKDEFISKVAHFDDLGRTIYLKDSNQFEVKETITSYYYDSNDIDSQTFTSMRRNRKIDSVIYKNNPEQLFEQASIFQNGILKEKDTLYYDEERKPVRLVSFTPKNSLIKTLEYKWINNHRHKVYTIYKDQSDKKLQSIMERKKGEITYLDIYKNDTLVFKERTKLDKFDKIIFRTRETNINGLQSETTFDRRYDSFLEISCKIKYIGYPKKNIIEEETRTEYIK